MKNKNINKKEMIHNIQVAIIVPITAFLLSLNMILLSYDFEQGNNYAYNSEEINKIIKQNRETQAEKAFIKEIEDILTSIENLDEKNQEIAIINENNELDSIDKTKEISLNNEKKDDLNEEQKTYNNEEKELAFLNEVEKILLNDDLNENNSEILNNEEVALFKEIEEIMDESSKNEELLAQELELIQDLGLLFESEKDNSRFLSSGIHAK